MVIKLIKIWSFDPLPEIATKRYRSKRADQKIYFQLDLRELNDISQRLRKQEGWLKIFPG